MAWDPTRPVPWRRLIRDWMLYVGIMLVVLVAVYRDRLTGGILLGLIVSGPLFIAVGAVLAKFGYQRKTLRELRSASAARASPAPGRAVRGGGSGPRPRPAPTRRTSPGPRPRSSSRPGSKRKR